MKKLLSLLSILIFTLPGVSQVPDTFHYQAVIRDSAGEVMSGQTILLQLSVRQNTPDGPEVFSEEHTAQTNAFGLVNVAIGSVESMAHIDWSAGSYYLEVSVDGHLMGTTQLLSVPFAMHAATSADAFSGDYHDLQNKPQGDHPGDMMYWDGENWIPIGPGQQGQMLTWCNGLPVWGPCDDDNGDEVVDYDGNVYETVIIGEKEWFAENLKSLHYADGTPITGVFAPNNDENMVTHYGRLYTWDAVMNGEESDNSNPGTVQGVCPDGWRVPSDAEMIYLTEYLGGSSVAGGKLKSTRTFPQDHPRWNSPNAGANNESGFTAYPGGRINADGSALGFGTGGYLWTSTESSGTNAWGYLLYYSLTGFYKDFGTKAFAFSVRCVRNTPGNQ